MSEPRFELTAGSLRSTTANPAGLPTRFVVERDMDRPADGLRIRFGQAVSVSPGDPVTLALGYDATDTVFTGEVVTVRPGPTGTAVAALGSTLALLRLRVSASYDDHTAGAIVRDLADRAGVDTGTVEDSARLPFYVLDQAVTGHAHAKALADRGGFELYTDRGGALMFHAPQPIGGVTYTYRRDLLGVGGRTVADGLAPTVGGESPSSQSGQDTTHWLSTDDLTGGSGDLLVLDAAARTQDLADSFAAGRRTSDQRGRQTVTLRVLGRAEAELGEPCRAGGDLPDALTGAGYVRALRHDLDVTTGWTTRLTVATGMGLSLGGSL
ncbi:hypothetical protein [Kutzneria sp. NPDC052558]|uniref:hypothetical protein n=1 Tax=Kutzneria sp. NPDC052558 TaxID=3364121 RepID=UPI0037C7BB9B